MRKLFSFTFILISLSINVYAQESPEESIIDTIELNVNSGPILYSNAAGVTLGVEGNVIYRAFSFFDIMRATSSIGLQAAGSDSDIHHESMVHLYAKPGLRFELFPLPPDTPFLSLFKEDNTDITLDLLINWGFGIGYVRSDLVTGGSIDLMSLLMSPSIGASINFGSMRFYTALEYQIENIDGYEKRGVRVPFGISLNL